jgi:hypothetical protein
MLAATHTDVLSFAVSLMVPCFYLLHFVFSIVRPAKPPPPPRNQSLDAWGKTIEGFNKPARPPPPKSAELLWQQKQPARQMQAALPVNNLYANLGGYSM